jgi:hypothetical protein
MGRPKLSGCSGVGIRWAVLAAVALINIGVVVLLYVVFTSKISWPWERCRYSDISAWSMALTLLLIFHLIYHLVPEGKTPDESIKIGQVSFPTWVLEVLRLRPGKPLLSDRVVLALNVLLVVIFGVIGLNPFSLFSPSDAATPIIQSFTVHYPDGTAKSLKPGDVVEIMNGEQMLVEAQIPGQSVALCTWSTGKGVHIPASGCSTVYGTPLNWANDTLVVLAQAPCSTAQAYAGLFIKVVQSRSQP